MNYYLAVLLGAIIYVLMQLNGVLNLPDFSWSKFFKTNAIPAILNLIIGFALVYIREDIQKLYPITMLTALLLGVSGQLIFKKLQDSLDPSKKTFIGING
jgi:hypothetical protein